MSLPLRVAGPELTAVVEQAVARRPQYGGYVFDRAGIVADVEHVLTTTTPLDPPSGPTEAARRFLVTRYAQKIVEGRP